MKEKYLKYLLEKKRSQGENKKKRFSLKALYGDTEGQGTIELALVVGGILAMLIALGVLGNALMQGVFVEHALLSASHHVQEVSLGVIGDVFLY